MNADVGALAQGLLSLLAPFLPYLLKMGESAAEEAGRKLGDEAWERAKALWGRIHPAMESRPAAYEALQDVVAHPDDPDSRAALRLQLRKLLTEEPSLVAEIASLLPKGTTISRSIVIGGSADGSVNIIGDDNIVR